MEEIYSISWEWCCGPLGAVNAMSG